MGAKTRLAIITQRSDDGDDWRGLIAEWSDGAWTTIAWTVFLDGAEAMAWARGEVDRGAADEWSIGRTTEQPESEASQ